MMGVALVQVGDDLDVAPGVMRVGSVTAGWGAVEGYPQKIRRQEFVATRG